MRVLFLFVAVVWGMMTPALSAAGWMFVSEGGGEKGITTIDDNQLKYTAPDHTMIFDLNENRITFINPQEKTFWSETPQSFAQQARMSRENIGKMLDEQLKQVPKEQRETLEKVLRQQVKPMVSGPPPQVTVQATGKTDKIAGRKVEQYLVLVNGEKKEELWIAPSISLEKDFDITRYGRMMRDFQAALGNSEEAALSEPVVMALLKKGWPLRTVMYDEYGYPETEEVVEIEEKEIPPTEFDVPKGYERMAKDQIFGH